MGLVVTKGSSELRVDRVSTQRKGLEESTQIAPMLSDCLKVTPEAQGKCPGVRRGKWQVGKRFG